MKQIRRKFENSFIKKHYLEFSLYCLLLLLAIVIVSFAIVEILIFLLSHFDLVLVVVGGYIFLFFMWRDWCRGKQAKQETLLSQAQTTAAEEEQAFYENNYSLVRQCLYITLGDVAERIHLVKPTTLSQMDSPSQFIVLNGVTLFQFVALKQGGIDVRIAKEILQTRINQRLSALEFPGLTQTVFVYEGHAYPILCIHEIQDIGSYVQISVAFSSTRYAELLMNKVRARQENQKPLNPNTHDKDF